MKRLFFLSVMLAAFWSNAATFPNRYTTNTDGTIIDGGSISNILHGFITPFDCGAVGDAVTDDYNALQKWLFIAGYSNWVAFLPPAPGGFYACSQTLLVTNGMNNMTITGAGGAMHDNFSKCQIKFTSGGNGFRIINSASNIRLDGIMVTSGGTFSAASKGIWWDGDFTDNDLSSIKNCGVLGFGTNILLSSAADMVVENCSVRFGNVGLAVGPGTLTASAVINQVHIRGCQLSYNTNNQVYILAGQSVKIDNCDVSAQSWATGPSVYVDGHGTLTMSDMHGEPYNGKPLITVTDRGNGAGSVGLALVNFSSSADGNPGPNSYTLVATNAVVSFANCAFGDAADAQFVMSWTGDTTTFRSDRSVLTRIFGAASPITNYIGGSGFAIQNNFGAISAYGKEGDFLVQRGQLNLNPGGGLGGGYTESEIYWGARTVNDDNSLGLTLVPLLGYYKDRTVNGPGISSTNGFITGTGTGRTPILTNFTSYASGTAYTLTGTPAQLTFGTTSPGITIQNGGTYMITATAGVKYSAATYAGAQTITLKLRRTNNTPADLTSGSRTVELPVLTTFTGGDVMTTPTVIYTAVAGDIVQLFGSVSATPSAGSVQTDSAEIVAIRLF